MPMFDFNEYIADMERQALFPDEPPVEPTQQEELRCKQLRKFFPERVALPRKKKTPEEKLEIRKKQAIKQAKKCRKLYNTRRSLFGALTTDTIYIPNLNRQQGEPRGWRVNRLDL
jgi:hypothetical protein